MTDAEQWAMMMSHFYFIFSSLLLHWQCYLLTVTDGVFLLVLCLYYVCGLSIFNKRILLTWLPIMSAAHCISAATVHWCSSQWASFQQPGYLADLISPYSQPRLLRSSTQKLLSVPPHNLDTPARRFSVAAPRLWNCLPLNCRTAPSINTFKIRLKTFFFDSA